MTFNTVNLTWELCEYPRHLLMSLASLKTLLTYHCTCYKRKQRLKSNKQSREQVSLNINNGVLDWAEIEVGVAGGRGLTIDRRVSNPLQLQRESSQ
jgi:Fe-S oxidoreductase